MGQQLQHWHLDTLLTKASTASLIFSTPQLLCLVLLLGCLSEIIEGFVPYKCIKVQYRHTVSTQIVDMIIMVSFCFSSFAVLGFPVCLSSEKYISDCEQGMFIVPITVSLQCMKQSHLLCCYPLFIVVHTSAPLPWIHFGFYWSCLK